MANQKKEEVYRSKISRTRGDKVFDRKFFDIHVPLSSKELLLTAPIERLVPDGDFDEAADCQKFHAQPATVLALTPGMFAVCFPGDGHMPLVCEEGRGHVEKWIFKVRI